MPRNADFYICGPSAFMSDLTAGLAAWGVAPDRIHTEMFRRRSVHYPGHRCFAAPAAAPAGRGLPARDRWSRSPGAVSMSAGGRRSRACSSWPKRATSLCDGRAEPGVCHTCETGLVAGTVSYRPEPVDAPADGNVLICCSQPESDVVIDL